METEAQQDTAAPAEQEEARDGQTDELGEKGHAALVKEREARKQAEKELRAAHALLEEARAKAEGREAEHAEAVKAREAQEAAIAKANERVLMYALKSAAAGKLTNPADAAVFVDLSQFEVGADGQFDEAAVEAAIDDLLKERPYLAVAAPRRFEGSADQGRKGAAPGSDKHDMNSLLRSLINSR
ncbi:hypothetical protein M3D15_04600 [Pseudoclavibacter alba]|uniref:DUF4355 domain-containing protein n=1 Tax=Pseudoclavibacter albus TaxID=272241 RepID=A0ABT2HWV0_9MICO|nr:hypothetical protein [Pseudoclavibacter alba]MCT2042615.1 hypothetical protein [Pseudoclavibacter alba]